MSKEDPDVCEALRSLLADEGIDILLNARIKQVSGKCGDSVSVVGSILDEFEAVVHGYEPAQTGEVH
jgi:NADPH-dependent 2,4-dienoyl-CoA reductase/sulfur reductase-like enzyme